MNLVFKKKHKLKVFYVTFQATYFLYTILAQIGLSLALGSWASAYVATCFQAQYNKVYLQTIRIITYTLYWKSIKRIEHFHWRHAVPCCPPIWPSDCTDWPGYPGQSHAPCAHVIIMHLNHEWRSSCKTKWTKKDLYPPPPPPVSPPLLQKS